MSIGNVNNVLNSFTYSSTSTVNLTNDIRLDTTKIDSLLQYWSFHPEELRKTVDNLLNKK